MIALFNAGLHDPDKPIGAFMFVGPTGVGKTELARALATFLFGSPRRLLRFDLSEFKDYHAFEMLVGKPERPEEPARLLDPVRTNPFQVILLDELEKAHLNVRRLVVDVADDALEKVIDEGFDFRYGARALKREIRRSIVVPIATVLMERTIDPGSILKIFADKEGTKVRVVETAESRAHKRSREPVHGEIVILRLINALRHLPRRVRAFSDFLATRFGEHPYWDQELDQS